MTPARTRPRTSVIVPFGGTDAEALELTDTMEPLDLRQDDRLVIVDNTVSGLSSSVTHRLESALRAHVVRAAAQRSSYYARNLGVDVAKSEWLLFLDADCIPRPKLLAHYFDRPILPDCGAVVGEVVALARGSNVYVRYAISRSYMRQGVSLVTPGRGFAATANLLVRRQAWSEIGGFCEGVVSGADQDFSWRLRDAGWTIAYRPNAVVEHAHRTRLRPFLGVSVRYGRGRAWLNRRRPGIWPRPKPGKALLIGGRGLIIRLLLGQLDEAAFPVLDVLGEFAAVVGYVKSNRPASLSLVGDGPTRAVVTPEFPSERGIEIVSADTHIEALARSAAPRPWFARECSVTYAEDDSLLEQVGSLARLVQTDPGVIRALWRNGDRLHRSRLLRFAPTAYRLRRFRSVTGVGTPESADRSGELDLVLYLSGHAPSPTAQTSTFAVCAS